MSKSRRTAAIIIHGIGEQRPMDTLWSFLDAAWANDRTLVADYDKELYSKPGIVADNYELRRVTTRKCDPPDPRRFDFYEYYWAHMMTGNTIAGIWRWLGSLYLRLPGSLPPGYFGYWLFGWTVGLIAFGLAIWGHFLGDYPAWLTTLLALGGVVGGPIVNGIFVPYVGDAARYLRADPGNVEARQRIRAGGVDLLRKLHATGDYDRIVVVGHSLGSVVAYDMLTQAWAEIDPDRLCELHATVPDLAKLLKDLEEAGGHLKDAAGTDAEAEKQRIYRNAQRAYRRALASVEGSPWLVSDLVTLGSPLGKGDLLLADNADVFEDRKGRREFPTSPPLYEYWSSKPGGARHFSYPRCGQRVPHHAAPFAPTVWSNVYFPVKLLFMGDPVSGAVKPHFGAGVVDTALASKWYKFQHLDYWAKSEVGAESEAVQVLRRALNLRDADELQGEGEA